MTTPVTDELHDAEFSAAYADLELRMKALAEADGDVFLPKLEPAGPVQHVFVCMEPSLGGTTLEKARAKIGTGFRNFVNSTEDFLLHFAIQNFLCKGDDRYHITDWSKGAMSVTHAAVARMQRYDRWYPLLGRGDWFGRGGRSALLCRWH